MMSQCHILIILYLNLNIMNFVLFKDAVIYLTNQIDLDKKPVFRDLTHIGLIKFLIKAYGIKIRWNFRDIWIAYLKFNVLKQFFNSIGTIHLFDEISYRIQLCLPEVRVLKFWQCLQSYLHPKKLFCTRIVVKWLILKIISFFCKR